MSTTSFRLTGASVALLSLAFVNSAFAAEEKIDTVYVSATRSEGPQMPVATQITVIDSEQIRLSGATTITEILRVQAGIQLTDSDGSGGRNVTVSMRGLSGANNTLILVDGRKLNNPSLAAPALNTIALKDIERIEIVQGSAGVLYGDQAEGGVINVITRKAKQGELIGSISADKGSDNLESYIARVNQGFANGLSYSLSAQKRNADNFRDNNQSALTNVLGNIGFDFSRGKVFIERQTINDNLRLAGSLSDVAAAVNSRSTNTPNDYANQDTDLTRVGGDVKLMEDWTLLGEYADRDETGEYLFADYNFYTAYGMRVKNITPRIVGNLMTANGTSVVTLGYDKVDASYATTNKSTDFKQKVDGFYGQVIYPFSKALTGTAGVRHSTVDDKNNIDERTHTDKLNSIELGLNYQIDSAWRVFTRYADGFRVANADENAFVPIGVTFLNAQTSQSQEAGVAWSEKMASVKYSIYRMTLEDELTFDAISFANINLPKSERQGFMFEGDVQLSEQISVHGNYTFTDAALIAGSFSGKDVPFVAKNTANIGFAFNLVADITTSIDANYTGSRYRTDDYANTADKVDAITLFNVNILWDIDNVELGFRVKNITAEKYSDYQGIYGQFPQPGRTYNAHISYRF